MLMLLILMEIKHLAIGLSDFFINGKPIFSNGPRNPKNPNCTILDRWVFNNFILADKLFAKALQSLETCVSVNNNLCGKLLSLLETPITFGERFYDTRVPFYIPNSNLLSCELDSSFFKVLHCVILLFFFNIMLKQNKFTILLWFHLKNLIWFLLLLSFSIMKNIFSLIYIAIKINLLYCLQISIKCLLFT